MPILVIKYSVDEPVSRDDVEDVPGERRDGQSALSRGGPEPQDDFVLDLDGDP